MSRTLTGVEKVIGSTAFRKRVEVADREAAALDLVLKNIQGGRSRSATMLQALPGDIVPSMLRRLRLYEAKGRDALISRRHGPPAPLKMTLEARGGLRALALSDQRASSLVLAKRLIETFETSFDPTLI